MVRVAMMSGTTITGIIGVSVVASLCARYRASTGFLQVAEDGTDTAPVLPASLNPLLIAAVLASPEPTVPNPPALVTAAASFAAGDRSHRRRMIRYSMQGSRIWAVSVTAMSELLNRKAQNVSS